MYPHYCVILPDDLLMSDNGGREVTRSGAQGYTEIMLSFMPWTLCILWNKPYSKIGLKTIEFFLKTIPLYNVPGAMIQFLHDVIISRTMRYDQGYPRVKPPYFPLWPALSGLKL